MGECGIPWKDYLYELNYWQILLHIRGYYHRNVLQYQLQRMNVWASMFCLGNPKGIMPEDIIKLYFDRYKDTAGPQISPEVQSEMLDLLDFYTEQNKKNGHV